MVQEGTISRLFGAIKNILFPVFCFGCEDEGKILCDKCAAEQIPKGIFLSFHEGALSAHAALEMYQEESVLTKLLWALKYQGSKEVLVPLRHILERFVESKKTYFEGIELVTAVPLHPRRKAERGFNQAEEIARIIAQSIGCPYADVLKRTRYTTQQATLDKQARQKNMEHAFAPRAGRESFPASILIVDDVFTTGATVRACATCIYKNTQVKGFSILRD